jgi:hypothetical protein
LARSCVNMLLSDSFWKWRSHKYCEIQCFSLAQLTRNKRIIHKDSYQQSSPQIEFLLNLGNENVGGYEIAGIFLFHFAKNIDHPFEMFLMFCDPDEIYLCKEYVSNIVFFLYSTVYYQRVTTFFSVPLRIILSSELWATSFKMEANGVTPIPPPTMIATGNFFQSWCPSPKGPSM